MFLSVEFFGEGVATSEELKEAGARSTTDFYEEVSRLSHINVGTVRARLEPTITQVKSMMMDRELIVQPEGWKRYMSQRQLILASVAFLAWKRRKKRMLLIEKVQFFQDFFAGEHYAVDLLPADLQAEARRKPGPRPASNVASLTRTRRSKAS